MIFLCIFTKLREKIPKPGGLGIFWALFDFYREGLECLFGLRREASRDLIHLGILLLGQGFFSPSKGRRGGGSKDLKYLAHLGI